MRQHDVNVANGAPDTSCNPDLLPGFEAQLGRERGYGLDQFVTV